MPCSYQAGETERDSEVVEEEGVGPGVVVGGWVVLGTVWLILGDLGEKRWE